jgi:hypothetical protein
MSVTMSQEDVRMMQPARWMTNPPWFLVTGLPWPDGQPDAELAEAAFAIAPDVTLAVRPTGPEGNPVPPGHDLTLMLDTGSRCAATLGKRVIFVAEITCWLADIGLSWERIGVDFQTAQAELGQQSLGLFVTVSPRTYTILCATTRNLTIYSASGGKTRSHRKNANWPGQASKARLAADWPGYVTKALASAQPAA